MSKVKSQKLKSYLKDKSQIHSIIQSFNHSQHKLCAWLNRSWRILAVSIISVSLSVLILSACETAQPIPEEKFILVYVDLLIARDTTATEDYSLDSLKKVIFSKHQVTSEDYNNTIEYYNNFPQRWEAFFDKAIAYVEELKTKQEE